MMRKKCGHAWNGVFTHSHTERLPRQDAHMVACAMVRCHPFRWAWASKVKVLCLLVLPELTGAVQEGVDGCAAAL